MALLAGCSSSHQLDDPIAALSQAIHSDNCTQVYSAMSDDVRARFSDKTAFCEYFAANRFLFEHWIETLEDRYTANDYERYAYVAGDPAGALKLKYEYGKWEFDDKPTVPVPEEELSKQFVNYIYSYRFQFQLQELLEASDPLHAEALLNAIVKSKDLSERSAAISFDGPFVRVQIGDAQLVLVYHKQTLETGTWELYRCLLNQ